MDIPNHDLTRNIFYTPTNVITSVADVIFFYRVTNENNSMSLAPDFPNYNPHSSPHKFKREVQEYLFDLAKKNFQYTSYPYGWTVFEGNQTQAPLGT